MLAHTDLPYLLLFILVSWLLYRFMPLRPRTRSRPPPHPEALAAARRAGHPSALRVLSPAERRQVADDAADRLAAVGLPCTRRGRRPVIRTERHGCRYRLSIGARVVTVDYLPELRSTTRREFPSAHEAVVNIAVVSGAATCYDPI